MTTDGRRLSVYETAALKEIRAWKAPDLGWFGSIMKTINWPLDRVGDLALGTPGLGFVIKKSVHGLISLCNDVAQWSVRPDAIYAAYRACGHENIAKPEDVFHLDLEQVDKVIGWLGAKYKGIALVEGGATGFTGLPGIPPDIAALITMNLRAIGEYATYCGFDISQQHERLFAMNVFGLASSPSDASKVLALSQLAKIAQDVAKKVVWRDLNKNAIVKVIQQIAKALGIRLTKAKLAQVLPALGMVVGGGFNAYFTAKVCDAAYFLYRERFLAGKYGADIILETDTPPKDIGTTYPESLEDVPEEK